MKQIIKRPESLDKEPSGYCPGCMHSMVNKLIAEVLDDMQMRSKTIAVFPVGCAVISGGYFKTDLTVASHGRAPAVATGIKRSCPDHLVFAYQGDGDLSSIGMAETIHAANRGENFSVIFMNNNIYGMTGGQMSPTTLVGQKATTAVDGRNAALTGYPIKMCELLNELEAPVYIARVAMNSVVNIIKAKNAIRKAFEIQMGAGGYCFVEVLSNCPTTWHMTPAQSLKYIENHTMKEFPLGVFRDKSESA